MKKLFILGVLSLISLNITFANDEVKYIEVKTHSTLENNWIMLISAPLDENIKYKEIKTPNTLSNSGIMLINEVENTTKLSNNDFGFYNHLLKQVSKKDQKVINNFLDKYNKKLSNYSKEKQEEINQKASKIVSDYIFENITSKHPQDIALPKKANRLFLFFSLLELELKK
ncbi:hypothetical protein H3C61_00345 [Candidatus Gracilibacteria bacterium]|nr:hypothetical protein [Candidatus Gracilibacteria bacterium]